MNPRPHPALVLAAILVVPFASQASDWPQWRGPARDDHVPAGAPVPSSLSTDPKLVWRLNIGGGFSSPVVQNGRLAYLDDQDGREVVHLVDALTGKEFWKLDFADTYRDEWGPGPRSTPIFDGDKLYVQSCNGEFRCLDVADGKIIWQASFDRDFGVRFLGSKQELGVASRRGNNGCGVIDGNNVVLPVGGAAGACVVCFDKLTGKVIWKSQNDEEAYSSLMIADLAGVHQVINFTAEGLIGVEAATGKLLWRVPLRTNAKRHAMTPVINGDTVIVNSHTFGLICFKIAPDGDAQKATELWANKQMKINLATPVLVNNFLYSHGPGKDYVCVDAGTGKLMWQQDGFGETVSATIAVGNNLLIQTDRGDLRLVAADPAQYTEKGRAQVCGKTWSHPAFANGKIYVREGTDRGWKLSAFDLLPP